MLAGLHQADDPNLLMGYKTNDDAGVYRLSDDLAIVVTADFITPPVNDPYQFGQIAAANAISDVYAMGGTPKVCLNLVSFPSKILPPDDLNRIVAGALDKITEAGAVLAGGHSVEDSEPKFGLAVVGTVHPEKFWTNAGAEPGDVLVLTKPIGSGVLFNANLKGWVPPAAMEECIRVVSMLNKQATETLHQFEVHAVTDVTGFGLAGHALEVAKASSATLEIEMAALPVMDEALEMYRKGMNTGVNAFNERLTEGLAQFEGQWPEWQRQILFDPQTSGGLLVAVPAAQAGPLVAALKAIPSPAAHIIGRVLSLQDSRYLVFK